jgi:hypothetical protein
MPDQRTWGARNLTRPECGRPAGVVVSRALESGGVATFMAAAVRSRATLFI